LLILSGKRVAADLELQSLQHVKRLALGGQCLARFAAIGAFGRKWNDLVGIRDGWQTEDIPFVGLA
jgi:hypothetical protein